MNRAPTSYRDMLVTVSSVRCSELEKNERIVLLTMAPFASQNGENCRPTLEQLRFGTDWSLEWTRRSLRRLEELGLIQLTHRGRGERNASIWRICLEHPAFPDTYPTLKTAVTATHELRITQVTATDKLRKPELIATVEGVNRNSEPSYAQLPEELIATDKLRPSLPPSLPTPHPTPPTAATADYEIAYSRWVGVYAAKTSIDATISRPDEIELRKLYNANPDEAEAAWGTFVRRAPWESFKTPTTHPFRLFLQAYRHYVALSQEPTDTKYVPTAEEAAAALERAAANQNRMWDMRPEEDPSEGNGSELFSEASTEEVER